MMRFLCMTLLCTMMMLNWRILFGRGRMRGNKSTGQDVTVVRVSRPSPDQQQVHGSTRSSEEARRPGIHDASEDASRVTPLMLHIEWWGVLQFLVSSAAHEGQNGASCDYCTVSQLPSASVRWLRLITEVLVWAQKLFGSDCAASFIPRAVDVARKVKRPSEQENKPRAWERTALQWFSLPLLVCR